MLELKKFQESAELLRSEEHDEFEESKLGLEKWYSKTKKRLKNWSKISATLIEEQAG
ncbi:hypothetical protein R9C00_13795 [Flammeovirgaceae bacterium SG7u.111]|nr:hypothetical protein [Flammeovirgaceae bacterium SG7u.132]WPO38528.1 hypothetical protein R9C00_13795 [Flammeovirgaceae bacterium SG7u.111]